jgi:aryl-alcohol dehydrogenase-like predicted oxidoreductase
MRYHQLPNGKKISRLGFGASSYWAKPYYPAAAAEAVLMRAYHSGINYFDSSPSYAEGEAERRLSTVVGLADREDILLSSKFGAHTAQTGAIYKDFSPGLMAQSVAGSLERLGTSYLDILFLHGPELEDLTLNIVEEMQRLKQSGRVRSIGVLSDKPEILFRSLDFPFDANMIQFNVVDQRAASFLADPRTRGRIIINTTILAQGIFSLKSFLPRDRKSFWYLLRTLKNNPLFVKNFLEIRGEATQRGIDPIDVVIEQSFKNRLIVSGLFGSTQACNVTKVVDSFLKVADFA